MMNVLVVSMFAIVAMLIIDMVVTLEMVVSIFTIDTVVAIVLNVHCDKMPMLQLVMYVTRL